MSKVEEFAREVTAIYGPNAQESLFGLSIIEWIEMIMEIVIEVIENCPNSNRKGVVAAIKRPGLFNKVRFRRIARQVCPDGVDYTQVAEACMQVASQKEEGDIETVVKEVQKPDYWLI